MANMSPSRLELEYMIHHVFLPPKLPGEGQDSDRKAKDYALIARLSNALAEFSGHIDDSEVPAVRTVATAIKVLAALIKPHGPKSLQALLPRLPDGQLLPIYVAEQNAGVIIRRTKNEVVFETLELTPPNAIVLGTQGRLKRVFPDDSVAVGNDTFADTDFIQVLSQTLDKMSVQRAPDMQGKARKAGTEQIEDRETTNPALVTKLLTGYLRGVGHACKPPRLWKNTRDEVMWSNARLPWHRSPVWLLARVVMQTTFIQTATRTNNDLYKEAMIFFMSRILLDAVQTGGQPISSDFLHCMVAKITKRMKKLADTHGHDHLSAHKWYPIVMSALSKAESRLALRWTKIQHVSDTGVAMSALAGLSSSDDIPTELTDLDSYIHGVLHPQQTASVSNFDPPPMVGQLPADTLPAAVVPGNLSSKNSSHNLHCMAAFESWVEHHLEAWLQVNQHDTNTCGRLKTLLESYHTKANEHYGDSPESISLAVLTCLELWVACDQSAIAIHPLLSEYNPEIPISICQSLLLPLKSQLERLSRIESYVGDRVRQATASHPNIFKVFGEPNTFAVKYFQSSTAHQQLKLKIDQDAAAEKAEKLAEYESMKRKHSDLMREHGQLSCSYYEDRDGDMRHDSGCRRCSCNRQAESLKINIFEWPLPPNTDEAQATVFEISCPPAFGAWRDATMYLLTDVFRLEYTNRRVPETRYEPSLCLNKYLTTPLQRVRLLSETKPMAATHRAVSHIMLVSSDTVCVLNGLQYQYYDQTVGCFVDRHHDTGTLSSRCVYTMPAGSDGLQQFLHRPHTQPCGPEPNMVLSAQSSCPASMSLEEFKALAGIPYGTRTQWSNILVQLAVPSVDFKKTETYLILLQAICQAGPPSSLVGMETARESHQDLQEHVFRRKLLACLANALQRIRENWESYQSLAAFIAIANRLATVAADGDDDYDGVIENCRSIAMQWMLVLRDRAREATDVEVRRDFLKRAFELALIGTATFHMDNTRLAQTLENPDAAQSLLHFYISIDETSRTGYDPDDRMAGMGYQRWARLASRTLSILMHVIISQHSSCLSDAVRHVWADYDAASPWQSCPGAEHWLTSQSHAQTSAGASSSLAVHFNLLTGELLVNGLPLSRLPANFESQTVYGQLFGSATIEVMPTSWPGMSFSSTQKFKGHQVYFGTDDSEDMKLTCTANNSTWDLIPRRVLCYRVPHHFLVDYTHWYHRETQQVEFRPLEAPWVPRPSSWLLHKILPTASFTSPRWKMVKGEASLVIDRNSRTSREMARVFSPVEEIAHLHLIFDHKSSVLKVKLPRLKIEFFMPCQKPWLWSREFRGMYLDQDTKIGTLVGLTSKLVLRDDKGRRAVLIPGGGNVAWTAQNGHSKVRAVLGTCDKVHHYVIDDQLGRLVDNGRVQSKLYLCFLHALTSYCVPDPLTSLTGTERALAILSESDIPSAARLTQENVDMLHKIAGLAPHRAYYPRGLCEMQDVEWDKDLSFLSQHAELYFRSEALLADAARREFFHQDKGALVGLSLSDNTTSPSLLRRDANRASTFYRAGFGGELFSTEEDGIYTSRISGERLHERQCDAYRATSGVVRSRGTLQYERDFDLTNTLLALCKRDNILGVGSTLKDPIAYDADYVKEPVEKLVPIWWLLHQRLQNDAPNRFAFAMFTATLAFSDRIALQVIDVLCAMYTNHAAKQVELPRASSFSMMQGHEPARYKVSALLQPRPYADSDESRLVPLSEETKKQLRRRRKAAFESQQLKANDEFTEMIEDQWPCAQLRPPGSAFIDKYFATGLSMDALNRQFQCWWNNRLFYKYLGDLTRVMAAIPQHALEPPVFDGLTPAGAQPRLRAYTTTSDLFTLAPPVVQDLARPAQAVSDAVADAVEQDVNVQTARPALPVLDGLCDCLAGMADQQFKKAYVADLRKSIDCIQDGHLDVKSPSATGDENYYRSLLTAATDRRDALYNTLQQATTASLPAYQQYSAPRPSPLLYLAQLSHTTWPRLSPGWQKAIIAFGCAVTDVQCASRLVAVCRNAVGLARELANPGHDNWDPLDNPEVLLQEVMGGILVRRIQMDIARTMAGPPGGQNAVMQLNMGEGKSSVIAPIVAASLADGTCLVMVIVDKPQSKQMLQMLVSKLGGLSGRRIHHMPFSRSLVLTEEHYDAMHKMCQDCRDAGGIMLVQPEHLLSFQLCGPELAIAGKNGLAAQALKTQTFFKDYARCIVDESDENFSVKFELVYTMGTQSNVELSPDRWVLIQAVLGIVQDVAPLVKKELPLSIDIEREAVTGSFPRIRFLRDDGRDRVCQLIADTVCQNGIHGLPIGRQTQAVRDAIKRYITETHPSCDTVETVETCPSFWTETVKPRLYLLRGLLGRGVLGFAFGSKRWRVNYGVDDDHRPPRRLAVPFRAKDQPALQSEFSHPDVVIVLTCLSYYYSGLTSDDIFASLQHLALSDQASAKYNDWVRGASPNLPEAFRSLSGVNIKDRHQCEHQVFPHLRRSKGAIDYFLSSIVFPKEMKEFPHKLSASGWDIGKQRPHPTTGFSGTSDSQHLLPLSVKHLDLPGQRHTNALVLYHLVQPKNTVVYMPARGKSKPRKKKSSKSTATTRTKRSSTDRLLRLIVDAKPAIQVILDAGAQILELTNDEMAKQWLLLDKSSKDAVVYCGDNDDVMVVDKSGHAEVFQTSPFAQQLDRCLVFLDEAHTRGIDLKLPPFYRAAVTLGANLTKDRLVQACMRMRQLGQGQSVVFYVTREIQDKIAAIKGASGVDETTCTVADILAWAMSETWADLSRSMPLWAVQGTRCARQKHIWDEAHGAGELTQACASKFLEDEAMSLAEHYMPRATIHAETATAVSATEYLGGFFGAAEGAMVQRGSLSELDELERIVERCRQFDAHQHAGTAALHEEQERELAPEIENEKQVERPHELEPLRHRLHPDIIHFVQTGKLPKRTVVLNQIASLIAPPENPGRIPAFWSLANTTAAEHIDVRQFPRFPCVVVSVDFAYTVNMPSGGGVVSHSDAYLRTVQWVLTRRSDDEQGTITAMVLISPYEAQHLMPEIKKAKVRVFLSLYAPRSSQDVAPIDHLQLYTVPPPPTTTGEFVHDATSTFSVQLNLFAGQLYFSSAAEYRSACKYLGLAAAASTDSRTVVGADGFILAGEGQSSDFTTSPAAFLGVYLAKIRWNCDTIDKTHWGKVLGGQFLVESDFE